MATKLERVRELAQQYGADLTKDETEEKQENVSKVERVRQLAEKYGARVSDDEDSTVRVYQTLPTPTGYQRLVSDLGAHGRVTPAKRSPGGETQRSGTKGEDGSVLPGARWDSENQRVTASVRTSAEVQADMDALDEKIHSTKYDAGKILFGGGYSEDTNLIDKESRVAALENEKERLKQERSAAKTAEYDALQGAEDYAENSGYHSTRTETASEVHRPIVAQSGIMNGVSGYGDWVYEYINKNPYVLDAVREYRKGEGKSASAQGYDLSYLEQMDEDEVRTYNYLYAAQGKDAAQEFLDYIQSDPYYEKGSLNKRQRTEAEFRYSEFAKEHPVVASAVSVAQLPATAIAYAGQAFNAALSGGELDPNASYNKSVYTKSAIRDSVSGQIEKKWGKVGSFAYNVGMSMADFLTSYALTGGVGTSFVLGSNAAAETTLDALDRGVDGKSALLLGAVAGAAEYFTEKFSVEKLFNSEWSESAIKYIVKNTLSETGEEFASSIVNTVADVLISGDKSEWQQMVNAYMEQGFSTDEAFNKAFWEHAKMLGLDALGGAISGGLMAGGGVAIGKAGQAAVERESGRQVQDVYRSTIRDNLNDLRGDAPYTLTQAEQRAYSDDEFTPEREYVPTQDDLDYDAEYADEDAVFRVGSDPSYGQLMTLAEEDKAKAIEAAPDELAKTTIKYDATREQYNQARVLSKITGKSIVFFEQEGVNGTTKNGYYTPDDDTLHVNVRSKQAVPMIVAHELTHSLQNNSGYSDLRDIAFADLRRTGHDIDKMREERAATYRKAGEELVSGETVDQEIIAKFAETAIGDIRKFRNIYRANPSLGRKITRAVDKLLIRATGMQDQTVTAYLERLSAMQHRADEIVEKSEEEINRRLDEKEAAQAEAAPAGEGMPQTAAPAAPQNSAPVQTAETPAVPKPAPEEPQKPSETVGQRRTAPQTGGTVYGGTETRPSGTETQETARTSMDESAWADMMLDELNQRHENGEISDEEYDEAYKLIEEARMTGRGLESSADVVDYPEGRIPEWVRGKAGAIREKLGIKPKEPVQYSISAEEDSEGNSLTEEQARYFAYSKIRDDGYQMWEGEGKLVPVYHGTDSEEFTVFDRKRLGEMTAGNATDEYLEATAHVGFWFSTKDLTKLKYSPYSRSEKVYLNIENPRIMGSLDEMVAEIEAYTDEETARDMGTAYRNRLVAEGYDGIIITSDQEFGGTSFVAFEPNQIKRTNNLTPSLADDIRYSISEDEDTTPYGSLPVKAQNRVRDLERKFGVALDKMFGLGMTYKSPDFRAFLQSNVRPLVNAYLENGIIPEEESDALFAQFFDPATGTDEALQKQEFYNAFEEMEEGLFNVARWSQSQTAVPETDREDTPIPTTEEAEQLFAAQRDARREMDKVMYRVLLRPEDEVTVGKLLRGELSPDQVTENRADILEAYRVQKAFRDADAAVSVYKKRLKAELYKHVDKYLGNIAQWKDKRMPLMYQRETMERNIRDIIPDKAEADAFIAEFITPVHRAEAQRQRFLGEYRERVKKLNLSTKVQEGNQQSEAYAVQFLGEAADNIRILSLSGKIDQQRDGHTLEEWKAAVEAFWAANPNMNRAKIDSAIGEFRRIYNELLPKLNEVRIRNGYAPVAFRQGYFPHFTATSEDTVLARILRPFGIEFNADALPTSINGLTADFKPGITYFQFGNERLGFETTYDALQGYEMYLNAASDVIYHTDNIQKLRALAARIRYLTGDEGIKQQIDKVRNNDTLDEAEKQVQLEEIYRKGRYRMSNFVITMDEYTNGLANKKSRFDRGVEELFGRPAYSVMKALESRVASNMIVGNLGSALTNIIPLHQATAIIGGGHPTKGEGYILKGMFQTIHGMVTHDNLAAMSDFLANRRGADALVQTTSQKIAGWKWMPMNLIDNFVSETIVRAAYAKNLAAGMGEDLALQDADALAASIMADRSKGALPVLFNARNPLMKLFTQFQVEVNNEYSVIFKDIPELAKANSETKAGAIARITGMLFRYFVGAWLFNELYEKLFGRRAALDPVGMIANTVGSVAEGEDVGKALQTLGTEAVESLPFVGGVLGGGRVPIQSAIPDFADLTMAATSDTWTGEKKALTAFEELSKPAAYLLPPFLGGQIQKTLRGIAAAAQGGVYGIEGDEDGGAYLKYPVYDDPLDVTRSVLFGTTYTEGGQEWVDSGFKSLSVAQTAAYQAMKEFGADDRAAFDLIQEYKAVPTGEGRTAAQRDVIRTADIPGEAKFAAYYNLGASDSRKELMDRIEAAEPRGKLGEAAQVLMDISDIGTGKTAGTCDLLAQSGLSEDTKKLVYRKEVSDQKDDDIRAAELMGISFDEYLDAHAAYSTLYNNKTLSKSEQALEFSRYVEGTNLTAMQKETLREIFKYYSQVPVSAKNYNELRSIGVSDDYAAKIVREIDNLEPLPGKKSVSEVQKARVVVDEISDPDECLAALGTVLSDSQYRKVSIAADAGLDPEVWVAFREVLPEFDSDGNGSYTQEEMEDAIRAFSSGTNYGSTLMKQGRNLSRDEMAILWQIGGNWKSANNPFSKPTGKKVKELLDAEKKG